VVSTQQITQAQHCFADYSQVLAAHIGVRHYAEAN
jgi:hypothetical protein